MSLIRKTLVNIGDRIQLGNFDTAFVITVKTDNTGTSADNQIMLPIQGTNMVIDWGDGTQSVHTQTSDPDNTLVGGNNVVHTYSEAGTYNVRISKEITRILFNDGGDKNKVLSWRNCGVAEWDSFNGAFWGCSNLQGVFLDAPDLSSVSSMFRMFREATSFNQDIGSWDVSNVSDMDQMFQITTSFNQDIGNWDTGNVVNMANMFRFSVFNRDIGSWDVSNAEQMQAMFFGASLFNQDIGGWNVSNVERMGDMFREASAFNQDIGGWNVSNVTIMNRMFFGASLFNQDIGGWNVSNVEGMAGMFRDTPFNQDIGGWNVSNVERMEEMLRDAINFNQSLEDWEIGSINSTAGQSMTDMLSNCGMSTENYSRTIIGWANYVKSEKGGENLPANVILGATGMEYDDTTYADVQTHGASDPFTDAVAARAYLTSDAGSDPAWTITGDADVS